MGSYAQWGLSFSYDRYGNLLKEQSTAGSVGTTCLAVSTSTNQVTGTCALPSLSTYSYDANGNMLKDGANTLTYDAENRTTNAAQSGSSVADYVYDGNGLRVKKCVPSCSSSTTTTRYIYSGSSVIAEYENGAAPSAPTREYLYAGGLKVATVTGSTPMYHLRDHLSVRVNTDTSGMLIGEQGHYPFGDNWYMNSTTSKEMFTTYERDPETGSGTTGTGNDYAMARYNVNRLGRFSSTDPLSGNINNPQSLNRYAYVTNDPINANDQSGMDATAVGTQPGNCTMDGITADCGWVGHLCATVGECGSGGGGGAGGTGDGSGGWQIYSDEISPWDDFVSDFISTNIPPSGVIPCPATADPNSVICVNAPEKDPGPAIPTWVPPYLQPYEMLYVSSVMASAGQGPGNAGGGGGGGPQGNRPTNSVFYRLPSCGMVALSAVDEGLDQASLGPASPAGGSPEELMAAGGQAAMAQYVVTRGLVVPLRSSIYRALGAVAEGIELVPLAQLAYAIGYADVRLYQAKFQQHSCK